MANMKLSQLMLYDKWPGPVNFNIGRPNQTRNSKCGWDNTNDNFSTADATARALNANRTQRLGEKRAVYQDSTDCPGYYTMMYLCMHSFEDGLDISKDFSDGNFWCAPAAVGCISCSEWADTSVGPYFVVSRCTTAIACDVTKNGMIAVPCSTNIYSDGTGVATAGYGDGYGWFWVGGVCPCKDITILDDETGAGKGVEITCQIQRGPVMVEITGGTPILMGTDMSDLADATNVAGTGKDLAGKIIGWACNSAA